MRALARTASFLSLLATVAAQDVAFHRSHGAGCHERASESFYVWFADAQAGQALVCTSLTLVPTGSGYSATWGGVTYRAPGSSAVSLPPSDDGQVAIVLSSPLPLPGGTTTTLWVHSNGIVACGPGIDGGLWNTPPNDFTPSPGFCNAPDAAFFAWHDWNPAEPGSGRIRSEEVLVAGERVHCITWHDVENFPAGLTNRGTFQFQFGLQTGRVAYVWVAVDAATTSPFGSAHLVGWSPGGPSLDPGPVTPGTPVLTGPDSLPVVMAAAPAPISTPAAGTVVSFAIHAAPELVAGSPVRLGFVCLGAGFPAGVDLAGIGVPGCRAYLASIDVSWLVGGTSPDLVLDVPFPPGLPEGLDLYTQALLLVDPDVLGSPAGSLGLVTSNGLQSHVAAR